MVSPARGALLAIFGMSFLGCVNTESSDEVAKLILSECKLAKSVAVDPKIMMDTGYRFVRVTFDHMPDLFTYKNSQNLSEQEIVLNLFNLKSHNHDSGVLGGRLDGKENQTQIGFADNDDGDFNFEHSEDPIQDGMHYQTTYAPNDAAQRTVFEMIVQGGRILSVSFVYPGNSGPDKVCLKSFSL